MPDHGMREVQDAFFPLCLDTEKSKEKSCQLKTTFLVSVEKFRLLESVSQDKIRLTGSYDRPMNLNQAARSR